MSIPEHRRETYASLIARVDRIEAGLRRHGVGEGDVVACSLSNGIGYVAFILAVAKAGAVYVPMIREFDGADRARALDLTGPVLMVVDGTRAVEAPGRPTVRLGALEAAQPRPSPGSRAPARGTFRYLWTSGSTGFPKMMSWRQDSFLAERRRWVRHTGLNDTDVFFCRHPIDVAHATDLHMFAALLSGARLVVTDPDTDPAVMLEQVIACGTTVMSALPRHYDQFADIAEKSGGADLSRVRLPFCGGTYVGPNMVERCERALSLRIRRLYGSTEFGLAAVDLVGRGAADAFLPLVPGVEARLEPLGHRDGGIGELVLRSPHTSDGYLNDARAHARTFRGGEYRTGDVAERNASGEYRILGRVSETLSAEHGLLLAPALDEDIVLHCPVAEAVSVPVAPDGRGQAVRVLVRPRGEVGTAEAAAAVRRRLESHGLRGDVRATDRMPYTAVGKPNKAAIRRMWDVPAEEPAQPAG
ncbi:acyl-coenzyme A synthetase/AMP-(fatty) acid ligase [Nocardiopsis mwathae]|uniref:Acyl-coenzyme A synthetase/AMP-(Fatty) acid ligase n=1 Tax=Nocardiopsis mwathae TaxID=1472723 RepID=A0A7W9YM77_9ACTN|nr:acyl-coenzyme A synthetase/AMP-(fatty) acid ligase [Nocardiopsis mwathae]